MSNDHFYRISAKLEGFQPLGLVKPQIQSFVYHPLTDVQSGEFKISADAQATLDAAPVFAYRKAPGAVKPSGKSNANGYDGATNKDGLREGKGKQIFTDGSFYEGFWKNDKC